MAAHRRLGHAALSGATQRRVGRAALAELIEVSSGHSLGWEV
jgi:hypothetical protein